MANPKKSVKKKLAPRKKKSIPKKKAVAKKKGVKSLAGDKASMTVSVEFRLGGGSITAKLFRSTGLVQSHRWDTTGDKTFDDARSGDELSITGACSGKAKLTTDRNTTPPSSAASPRKYEDQNIDDGLGIN